MAQSLNFTVTPIFNLGPGWTTIRSLSLSTDDKENPGLVFYNKDDHLIQYSVSTPADPKFPQSIEVPPFAFGAKEGFTAVLPIFINANDKLEGLLFYAEGSGDAKYFRANSIQALPAHPVHEFAAEDNFGPGFTIVEVFRLKQGGPSDLVLYNINGGATYMFGLGEGDGHPMHTVATTVPDAAPGFSAVLPLALTSFSKRPICDELSYNATTGEAFYSQGADAVVPGQNPQINIIEEKFGAGFVIVQDAVVFSNVPGVPQQADRHGLLLYNPSTGEARVQFGSDGATFTASRSGNIGTGWTSIAPIFTNGPKLLLYKAATGDAAVTSIPVIEE
jgi:hypothetical protein